MSNEYRIQALFDEMMMMTADDLITLSTAQRLADELGIDFDPLSYDH